MQQDRVKKLIKQAIDPLIKRIQVLEKEKKELKEHINNNKQKQAFHKINKQKQIHQNIPKTPPTNTKIVDGNRIDKKNNEKKPNYKKEENSRKISQQDIKEKNKSLEKPLKKIEEAHEEIVEKQKIKTPVAHKKQSQISKNAHKANLKHRPSTSGSQHQNSHKNSQINNKKASERSNIKINPSIVKQLQEQVKNPYAQLETIQPIEQTKVQNSLENKQTNMKRQKKSTQQIKAKSKQAEVGSKNSSNLYNNKPSASNLNQNIKKSKIQTNKRQQGKKKKGGKCKQMKEEQQICNDSSISKIESKVQCQENAKKVEDSNVANSVNKHLEYIQNFASKINGVD